MSAEADAERHRRNARRLAESRAFDEAHAPFHADLTLCFRTDGVLFFRVLTFQMRRSMRWSRSPPVWASYADEGADGLALRFDVGFAL